MKRALLALFFLSWPIAAHSAVTAIVTPPAGSDTQVQYNNNKRFGADADFTFNGTTATITGASLTNLSVSGTSALTLLSVTSLIDSGLTSGRVPYIGTGGLFQDDPDFTFNGTTATIVGAALTNLSVSGLSVLGTVSAGAITGTSVTDSGLTSGRVPVASTGGLLADFSGFTHNGSTITNTGGAILGSSSGRVGIGTASPSYMLQVVQSSTQPIVRVNNGGNYWDIGGLGSGTAYIRAFEGIVAMGNEFGGPLNLITNNTTRVQVPNAAITTGGALCLNGSNVLSKCTTAVDASGNCTCP